MMEKEGGGGQKGVGKRPRRKKPGVKRITVTKVIERNPGKGEMEGKTEAGKEESGPWGILGLILGLLITLLLGLCGKRI